MNNQYGEVQVILDAALMDSQPIRAEFGTAGEAWKFYNAIRKLRKDAKVGGSKKYEAISLSRYIPKGETGPFWVEIQAPRSRWSGMKITSASPEARAAIAEALGDDIAQSEADFADGVFDDA